MGLGVVKKRLVILTPKLSGGGAERIVSYLSSFAPSNYEVVIVLFKKEISYGFKGRVYVIGDYDNIWEYFVVLLRLKVLLHRLRASAIMFSGKNKGITLPLFTGCKVKVLHVQNYIFEPFTTRRFKSIFFDNVVMKTLMRRLCKNIICVSRPIATKLSKKYGIPEDKITVIHNPCDVETILKMKNEPLDESEQSLFDNCSPVIINVGRMVRAKGQWHLIRAFKYVSDEIQNARLIIRGDGPLRNYLTRLKDELGLQDKVIFLGWHSNPFKYLARSTLFCLPSLWEGFGNVVVESLACGLPVMSADCLSGPREILAPRTEYKVERLREPEYGEYGILMPVMDGKLYTAKDH
jgi:glycosyltransferase involved in cell wall biosynthesis